MRVSALDKAYLKLKRFNKFLFGELWQLHPRLRHSRAAATQPPPRRRRRRRAAASNTMTTPGEYGGVSTVDTSAVAASIGAQVSQQAQELKRSVVNGSVELSTLGSIGAVLSVVVSCLNVLGNIVKLSPTRAVLMVYCFCGGLALLALEGMHNAPPFAPPSALAFLRRWKLKLRTEAHVLTTLTGRSLGYVFVGSLLLADGGSWLLSLIHI